MNDDELWKTVETYLDNALAELWDNLPVEDLRKVFPKLIFEYVEANY